MGMGRVVTSLMHCRRPSVSIDVPEAALAPLVARNGLQQILLGELRPMNAGKHELRVREAVEQEIAYPLLAPRANHEIGIAHPETRHALAERFAGHLVRTQAPSKNLDRKLAGSVRDLFPAAVAERKSQRHAVALLRRRANRVENGADRLGETTQVADRSEANAIFEKTRLFTRQKIAQ